jgi:predicted nucleic acid-binding protein
VTYHPLILIDTGVIFAYYSLDDKYHEQVKGFFERCTSQFVTTVACVTESLHLLAADWRVQNEFLSHVSKDIFRCEHLLSEDFARITELNAKYSDLPADFADLALIAISERLGIPAIATLDSDFDVYRRYRKQPFERVFRPH